MKKITIGLFCDSYFPIMDGVSMVVDSYARRLVKYANVVVVVPEVTGQKWDDSIYPYKIIRCKSFKLPFLDYSCPTPRITINFKKEIDKYKFDIIHIHSPFTVGTYGYEYAKKHNIPAVATLHTQFNYNFMRLTKSKKISDEIVKTIMKTYNKCDECWTVNNEMARILCENYKYSKTPLIMNNSTEMIPIKDINKSRKEVNKKYKFNDKERVFLFVGRIDKVKNLFFLIDALRILKNNNFKFKMLIVGCGHDENILKEYILENGLNKEVIMCGKILDRDFLASLYVRADLFLFPSLSDTNSLVQIEAATQKTPTVFIESATSSTVTNMVNGFITKNNVVEYADMIMNVMNNKKLYKEVSENAYRDLYKNWDDLVDNVYNRYLYLIKNKKR